MTNCRVYGRFRNPVQCFFMVPTMQLTVTDNTGTQDELRRIIDNVPEMVYSAVPNGPVAMQFISRGVEDLTGYTAEELLTQKPGWLDIVHEKDKEDVLEMYEKCRTSGEPGRCKYRVTTKDGSTRVVLDKAIPAFDQTGQLVAIDGIIVDLTPLETAQEQLEKTQILQNIGKLTAGILHEINTPVQFIGDNMQFLADSFESVIQLIKVYRQLKDSAASGGDIGRQQIDRIDQAESQADLDFLMEEIPKAISQTQEGVKRVTIIVSAMRDFSHVDNQRMSPANINKALESTLIVAHNVIKYVAEIETVYDENLPTVTCCIDNLNQVFVNLFVNAAHAIEDALGKNSGKLGKLTVTTAREDDNVVISIADTGTGMTKEVLEKIYEPFFTTKEHGKGTGQGLLLAKSIVEEKHNGTLQCHSEPGKGTTFVIKLPIETKCDETADHSD